MAHLASLNRSLSFTFLLASSLALAATPSAPVDYPDVTHVPNGCYLSSLTYLAKYSVAFPAEQARTLAFSPRGWGGGHFVALVTSQGEWWIRDEYFGVFPVGRKVGTIDAAQLDHKAAATFDAFTRDFLKTHHAPVRRWLPGKLTEDQKADSVAAAAGFLPFKTEQFRVKSGAKEMTFLFFRPVAGRIAVYEPTHGTAIALCAGSDAAEIVAAVATRFGYKVASVRSNFPVPTIVVAVN